MSKDKKTKKPLKEKMYDFWEWIKDKIFTLRTLFKETFKLIQKFFRPYKVKNDLLKLPSNLKKRSFLISILSLTRTIMLIIFSFLLKLTGLLIEQKMLILAVLIFILYQCQTLIRETLYIFSSSAREKRNELFESERNLRSYTIAGAVRNKIYKFDKKRNLYALVTSESIHNSLDRYLSKLWEIEIEHLFEFFEIISVLSTLVVAVVTNSKIPQPIFISLILIFSFISFMFTAYNSINKRDYFKKDKKFSDKKSEILTDVLQTPIVVKHDLTMRINKLRENVTKSNANVKHFHHKSNISSFGITAIESICTLMIILYYVFAFDISTFSLATITEITANLLIVTSAISHVKSIASTLAFHNDKLIVLEEENENVTLILDAYSKEINANSVDKPISNITLAPFTIKYPADSENDTPFVLKSLSSFSINEGEIAILTGDSGSGKSTFMKLITERIRIEKNDEIPSTSRVLFYDETLKLGNFSIFEELFVDEDNPNLEKMQTILENLHLWTEIKTMCVDVWQWMKEKKFVHSLSNGQKQRLLLAKILYWIDDNIDVVALDECTSGLDEKSASNSADAEKILEYLVRFCNTDKKRIVIISTHQNIDGFIQKLSSEYHFKNLHFHKVDDENVVEEI